LNLTFFPVTDFPKRHISVLKTGGTVATPELKDVFSARVNSNALYDSDMCFWLFCFLVVCYNWQSSRTENCQLFGEEYNIVDIWHEL